MTDQYDEINRQRSNLPTLLKLQICKVSSLCLRIIFFQQLYKLFHYLHLSILDYLFITQIINPEGQVKIILSRVLVTIDGV
jgi:hypothetical protein